MRDLVLLVADKSMDFAMQGILARFEAIGTRRLDFQIHQHPGRDGGVRTTGSEMLAIFRDQFKHGILMLDWEGCGLSTEGSLCLESELDARLNSAWDGRAKAIVIEPELETWIWGGDNMMQEALNWSEGRRIREWITSRGFDLVENQKPVRPKEAFLDLLKHSRQPISSAFYKRLTSRISLKHCRDPAFHRLRSALQAWFPV